MADYDRELDFRYSDHPRASEEGMKDVIGVTLRAEDGREQRTLVWLPTEQARREFYAKAARNGLEVIEH